MKVIAINILSIVKLFSKTYTQYRDKDYKQTKMNQTHTQTTIIIHENE